MANKKRAHKLIRDMAIMLKVSREEHSLLRTTADNEGLTLSASVRRSSLAYARTYRPLLLRDDGV